ncbi:putative leader peptide [Streptodolium elevatio]
MRCRTIAHGIPNGRSDTGPSSVSSAGLSSVGPSGFRRAAGRPERRTRSVAVRRASAGRQLAGSTGITRLLPGLPGGAESAGPLRFVVLIDRPIRVTGAVVRRNTDLTAATRACLRTGTVCNSRRILVKRVHVDLMRFAGALCSGCR